MMIEITKETYIACVTAFREGKVTVLIGFGGQYHVTELRKNQSFGEKDRFYAEVKLVRDKA